MMMYWATTLLLVLLVINQRVLASAALYLIWLSKLQGIFNSNPISDVT